jgi:uncharacterized protein YciU (UPF0263 family)
MTTEKVESNPLDDVRQQMVEMRADVHQIKEVLIGNEQFRQQGLLERVVELEKWKNNMTLKIATLSGASTVLILLGNKVFEYLNKHS